MFENDCISHFDKVKLSKQGYFVLSHTYAFRGWSYYKLGNVKTAEIELRQALNIIPNHLIWFNWYETCAPKVQAHYEKIVNNEVELP